MFFFFTQNAWNPSYGTVPTSLGWNLNVFHWLYEKMNLIRVNSERINVNNSIVCPDVSTGSIWISIAIIINFVGKKSNWRIAQCNYDILRCQRGKIESNHVCGGKNLCLFFPFYLELRVVWRTVLFELREPLHFSFPVWKKERNKKKKKRGKKKDYWQRTKCKICLPHLPNHLGIWCYSDINM